LFIRLIISSSEVEKRIFFIFACEHLVMPLVELQILTSGWAVNQLMYTSVAVEMAEIS
jgi:hypothetical protein